MENKFRVWDKEENRMISHEEIRVPLHERIFSNLFKIERYIYLQFTGFVDSEGVEIYKGDFIDSYQNDYQPTEVYWDEQLGSWATSNYHSQLALCDSMQVGIKVLGNKYENPELKENGNNKNRMDRNHDQHGKTNR